MHCCFKKSLANSSRKELTGGHEEVDVVRADEALGEADNRRLEADLAVVVCRVLGDIPCQLPYLQSVVHGSFIFKIEHSHAVCKIVRRAATHEVSKIVLQLTALAVPTPSARIPNV